MPALRHEILRHWRKPILPSLFLNRAFGAESGATGATNKALYWVAALGIALGLAIFVTVDFLYVSGRRVGTQVSTTMREVQQPLPDRGFSWFLWRCKTPACRKCSTPERQFLVQVTNPQVPVYAGLILPSAGSLYTRNGMRRRPENEKTPTVVIRKVRAAILDEVFLPGDWLPELDLAKRFHVSRSPIREALQALEKEGSVVTETRKGAMVKPLSVKEVLDIAEIRLDLITFAVKSAYPHLSAGDFDRAYELAKQITQSNSTKEQFEANHRFWDIIFEASRRPVRWEIFKQLDDRTTRYYPLMLRLFPAPTARPLQREALVEFYREGKIDEALAAFKKFYFEVVHKVIAYLEA